MKLNQQRLAIFLLSVRYCNVSATGDTTLGDLKRIFKFDLNEPPPLETDDTSPEENLTKDLIDNSHERAVGINPDLANVAAQYSRPISRPAIQTSDLEMLDYRSNRPQGVILGGPQEDDPDHPKSRGFPTRKAKTRLITDLYQPEDVWGKSDPRSRSMRSPFKALSSKNINISSVVDLKTSEPATTSRTTEAEAKEDYPQAPPKPRESTANFDRKRKSKMELTRISSMESKDKEIAISRVSKTQSAAKSSKEKELPNKSLGLTSSGGRLLGGSGIRDRNHMRMQKKLKYRNEDDDPEYDPQETDAVIPEISLRNSMEDHKFQTDSDEEIRDINKESQLQKQAKLRRDVVDWYRDNGFSIPRTAEKFSICYKTVRRYVDAAKALERQGASATSSTTEKKNILNGVTLLRYPDNFKRWAVKYYFEHGLGQEKTAQALGIPRGSLACWLTRYSFLKPGSTQKMVENNNIISTIHKKHTVIKPRKKQIKGVRRGPLNSTSA